MGDLVTVRGEEVSTADGHMCALGITSFIDPGLSRQATIDITTAQGGLTQLNHPARYDVQPSELDPLTGLLKWKKPSWTGLGYMLKGADGAGISRMPVRRLEYWGVGDGNAIQSKPPSTSRPHDTLLS